MWSNGRAASQTGIIMKKMFTAMIVAALFGGTLSLAVIVPESSAEKNGWKPDPAFSANPQLDARQRAQIAWRARVAETKRKFSSVTKGYFEGDSFRWGYMTYKVEHSWWSNRLSKNSYLDQKPDAMYLFVKLTVRNDDKKARMIPNFTLLNRNGAVSEASVYGSILSSSFQPLDSLNPSVSRTSIVVFDVPLDPDYAIWIPEGGWSNKKTGVLLSPKPL